MLPNLQALKLQNFLDERVETLDDLSENRRSLKARLHRGVPVSLPDLLSRALSHAGYDGSGSWIRQQIIPFRVGKDRDQEGRPFVSGFRKPLKGLVAITEP